MEATKGKAKLESLIEKQARQMAEKARLKQLSKALNKEGYAVRIEKGIMSIRRRGTTKWNKATSDELAEILGLENDDEKK